MFSLPSLSKAGRNGLPLGEHAGLLLVIGLMHDDLDDQQDMIRAALEIDPLLSTWTVCIAHQRTGAQLAGIEVASRWLADFLPSMITSPMSLIPRKPWNAQRRATWRKILVAGVATARRARQLALPDAMASASRAFWLGQLCATHRELCRQATLDGKSWLRKSMVSWPPWCLAEFRAVDRPSQRDGTAAAIAEAMQGLAEEPELATQLVSEAELELWFRPYPEFRMLLPLLLKKLGRLHLLEERFEVAVQQEKLASLEQLAYGASHEINNPLANIATRAQTLLGSEHDADRRRKLVAINEQAFRAYEMIADLMLFSKPPRLDLADVGLLQLIHGLRDELEPIAAERNLRLKIAVEDESLQIRADPVQLAVAVKAICTNGLEVMQSGGTLKVTAAHAPNCRDLVEIEVRDTGPGLSELARRHLFDPFFSGREAGRGLGFGLTKAWRIVEQHGGTIEVESRPAHGCTFTIRLAQQGPALCAETTELASENE